MRGPANKSHHRIAVPLEDAGRGGSRWLHIHRDVEAELPVSAPRNHFRLVPPREPHLLIAGGIGDTPLVAMARDLKRQCTAVSLHYCARNRLSAPLLEELEAICGGQLKTWMSDEGDCFGSVSALSVAAGPELCVCGSARVTVAVEQAAPSLDWPEEHRHSEPFTAFQDTDFEPEAFEAIIASRGSRLGIPADRSLFSVLSETGIALNSSRELGVCGACGAATSKVPLFPEMLCVAPTAGKPCSCAAYPAEKVQLSLTSDGSEIPFGTPKAAHSAAARDPTFKPYFLSSPSAVIIASASCNAAGGSGFSGLRSGPAGNPTARIRVLTATGLMAE